MTFDDFSRNERAVSWVAAVVMHLLFFALLVFGVSWQKRQPDSAAIVDLWNALPPMAQPKPEPRPEPEPPKPAPKPEPRPEPKPKPEPPPKPEPKISKPDIALKEKLEKERKLKEQEKAEQAKKLKEEQARKEKEKLEAKKREELKAQKEKEAAEQRAAQEQAEAQRKAAAAQAAREQKLVDEYINKIKDKIRRNIVEPPNVDPRAEVTFDVVVIPGGEVLSARLKTSKNSIPAYNSAVERAILKSQPLPLPPDPALMKNFRELNLVFRPKE